MTLLSNAGQDLVDCYKTRVKCRGCQRWRNEWDFNLYLAGHTTVEILMKNIKSGKYSQISIFSFQELSKLIPSIWVMMTTIYLFLYLQLMATEKAFQGNQSKQTDQLDTGDLSKSFLIWVCGEGHPNGPQGAWSSWSTCWWMHGSKKGMMLGPYGFGDHKCYLINIPDTLEPLWVKTCTLFLVLSLAPHPLISFTITFR